MKMIKFPSIEQFRSVVKDVRNMSAFQGLDDEGKAIYNHNIEKPTITFTGTVKIHGTNAGVCMKGDQLWAQSRNGILTPTKDNAGFAFFVGCNERLFKELIYDMKSIFNVPIADTLCIFGEWCGKGIQKGVAVNELERKFIIFGMKAASEDDETKNRWLQYDSEFDFHSGDPYKEKLNNVGIGFIQQFQTFSIDIDFNKPEESQNKLVELTEQVEAECPVGKYFGVSGVGEGIVWHCYHNDTRLMFKVKGEKHSVSKVKKLASVDPEKIANANKFAEYSVTEARLKQGISEVFVSEEEISKRDLGKFINWIKSDIFKEELDTLKFNNLEPKDVISTINRLTVKWFLENYG